jgi:ABC-type oligopeptide transport system substrate-binding subunit
MFVTAWQADYLDPYDFVNVLLDGDSIADDHNLNFSYFDDPRYNRLMHEAARLSGEPRYELYSRLDIDLTKAAPIVALSNDNYRGFIGPRVTNYIPHPMYGGILNALALK